MSQQSRRPAVDQRSADQAAHERAAAQVSDVLLTLEHALARAKKGLAQVKKDGADRNAELPSPIQSRSSSGFASGCSRTPTSPATPSG